MSGLNSACSRRTERVISRVMSAAACIAWGTRVAWPFAAMVWTCVVMGRVLYSGFWAAMMTVATRRKRGAEHYFAAVFGCRGFGVGKRVFGGDDSGVAGLGEGEAWVGVVDGARDAVECGFGSRGFGEGGVVVSAALFGSCEDEVAGDFLSGDEFGASEFGWGDFSVGEGCQGVAYFGGALVDVCSVVGKRGDSGLQDGVCAAWCDFAFGWRKHVGGDGARVAAQIAPPSVAVLGRNFYESPMVAPEWGSVRDVKDGVAVSFLANQDARGVGAEFELLAVVVRISVCEAVVV